MKKYLVLTMAVLFVGIGAQAQVKLDGSNQIKLDTLSGKKIKYYLNHKRIDPVAKSFYEGKKNAANDAATRAMLDSALTSNPETRPFYFFILNQVMHTKDEALSVHASKVCLEYFKRFPCEFFAAKKRYDFFVDLNTWLFFVGWEIYDAKAFNAMVEQQEAEFTGSCARYKSDWRESIDKMRSMVD